MPQNRLQEFLARLIRKEDLSREEATEFLEALLDETATDAQIAGALTALATKNRVADSSRSLANRSLSIGSGSRASSRIR